MVGADSNPPRAHRPPPGKQKPIPRWRTTLFPKLAAPLALMLRLYWRSVRFRMTGEAHILGWIADGRRVIPCCWHQRQVFVIAALRRLRAKGLRPAALVSPSKDGELAARLLSHLGVAAVRGSGRRSGALALRDMYLAIEEQDVSPLIAPDGSTGPPHEFKPGAIMLARLSACPIVPISFAATWSVRLRTWDRLLLPLPFSRVEVVIGAPIELGPVVAMTEDPSTIASLGAALDAVEAEAERRC